MSKSLLYATSITSQTLAVNDVISFGNIVRRYGCNCNLSGGNAVISGNGYYDIDTNFVFTASAAGTATITLYVGGVAIPGATASFTTVADSTYAVSIPAIVRETCCNNSTITAVLSGVAGSMITSSIIVEKV